MQQYILIGDSGHAKVIHDCIIANNDKVIAKLDDKYINKQIINDTITGPISLLNDLLSKDIKIVIAIGNNLIRKKIVNQLGLLNDCFATVIHPHAIVSKSAIIASGTVVMPGAVINADSRIGHHCIINSNSVVEHDCILGDFVHISPGAVLTGAVKVGSCSQVSANAVVIPGVAIGEGSIVGAGSTVTKNIGNYITVVGSPAKEIVKEGK